MRTAINDALTLAATRGIVAYDACYVVPARRYVPILLTTGDKLFQKLAGAPALRRSHGSSLVGQFDAASSNVTE